MAHIKKLTDKPRTLPWRAQVHRKGHKLMVKMFPTRKEADRWAAEQERSIRLAGLPLTIDDLKRYTVADIVRRYLKEITPTKGCRVSETTVLNRFLKRDIAKKSLAYVKKQDAWAYVNERQQETWRGNPITPRTIRREINSIQHVFEVAKERWGLENLNNPFRGISIKGAMHRRTRRLYAGELDRLTDACNACRGLNRCYVPLAIYLAIETGMRRQEIFNLKWEDIDFPSRQIVITKSKTDHANEYQGRTIVLPIMAELLLTRLAVSVLKTKRLPGPDRIAVPQMKIEGLIFPMSKSAFSQSWADVCKRARINNLHFHDLRHEAGSRFDEIGLTKAEHDLMMGHKNRDMTSIYIHSHLKTIRDKLDRATFKGQTLEEMQTKLVADGGLLPEEIVRFRAFAVAAGRDLSKQATDTRIANAVRKWNAELEKFPNADINFLRAKANTIAV